MHDWLLMIVAGVFFLVGIGTGAFVTQRTMTTSMDASEAARSFAVGYQACTDQRR